MNLREVGLDISERLGNIFLADATGRRPCHGDEPVYRDDPHWKDLVLFYEYFHGDTGLGCGARYVCTPSTDFKLRDRRMIANTEKQQVIQLRSKQTDNYDYRQSGTHRRV